MSAKVDLAFAESCEAWQVESRMFPSKIGGKPAWLDLENLPTPDELCCPKCKTQLTFMCQVYAPHEDDADNFHRTLFVFICRHSNCITRNSSESIKVFRSNLARVNSFYPFDAPDEKPDSNFCSEKHVTLCKLCGCFGLKQCGKCCKAVYCCRDHQIIDWKEQHKAVCGTAVSSVANSKILYPEFELIIEPEESQAKSVDENLEMEKFKMLELEGKTGTLCHESEKEIEAHAAIDQDKVFSRFKKQIQEYPDQVLRYERAGQPLWIAEEPRIKDEDVPACNYCSGPRQFEFQVMPQMLTILKENEIDWGILCIYTCKSSCKGNSNYKEEFVFKQDCSDS